jgi:hypothetical protein
VKVSLLFAALLACLPARAILLYGSGDPARNTAAPTGSLTNSGWQWQGRWSFALGTVIGPRQFVSASHLNVPVGSVFEFRGLPYTTESLTNLSGTDLNVYTVAGRFADYAPINTSRSEVGRPLVLFGRGGRRGEAFENRGWKVGDIDGVQRWGTNTVKSVIPAQQTSSGELLEFDFVSTAGADECVFSGGDSGAGTFMLGTDGVWRLAGVNYGVEGPYATNTTSEAFFGALFDTRGLYWGFQGQQQQVPNFIFPIGGRGFVTRVSTHATWLASQVSEAVSGNTPRLLSSQGGGTAFAEEPGYAVDPTNKVIRVPVISNARLFRLSGATRIEVEGVQNNTLLLRYE